MIFVHFIFAIVGWSLMVLAWWWDGNDLTLGYAVIFLIGSNLLGPLYVCLYWYIRHLSLRPPRQPTIILRGRGK